MTLRPVLLLAFSLAVCPPALQAQARDRQEPPQGQRGDQADRGKQARPKSPDADRPREQPKAPKSREPQLKRRKP